MGFFCYCYCHLLWILLQVRYRKKTQNQTNQGRFPCFSLKQNLKFRLILKLPVSNRVHKLHTDILPICLMQLACVLLDLYCKYCLELPETDKCVHTGCNANSIPWRGDHQAACGHGNHVCLPSPCSTVGEEQFVLSVAVLCTIWELLWSWMCLAFVLCRASSGRPHPVSSLPHTPPMPLQREN